MSKNGRNWLVVTVLGGAIGGWLQSLYPYATGQEAIPFARSAAIIAVGVIVALLGSGLFYLPQLHGQRSEERRRFPWPVLVHMGCFAVLCGLAPGPVLDAARALQAQVTQRRAEAEVRRALQAADTLPKSGTSDASLGQAALEETAQTTIKLIRAASRVEDPRLKARAGDRAIQLVNKLGRAAQVAPDSLSALGQVGSVAVEVKDKAVENATVFSLKSFASSAKNPYALISFYDAFEPLVETAERRGDDRLGMDLRMTRADTIVDVCKQARAAVKQSGSAPGESHACATPNFLSGKLNAGVERDLATAKNYWSAVGETGKQETAAKHLSQWSEITAGGQGKEMTPKQAVPNSDKR